MFDYIPVNDSAIPYVTIVTPFYNTGLVFHETAQSVMRQSFQQWEWLIINDGSTDPSALEILNEYRHRDPRVCVIDAPSNGGPSAARNTGFLNAHTDYIVHLDSDDLIEATAIEKWLWFLETEREFGFVNGYAAGFGAEEYLWTRGFHDGNAFLDENIANLTGMIRRAVWQTAGGYDESVRTGFEDWDFWMRCANIGYWGHTIPEYLDWYRRRPSHTDRWANFTKENRRRFREEYLQPHYPDLWNGKFPSPQRSGQVPFGEISEDLAFDNRLSKHKPRLLMLAPWLTMGGADKFNLDLLQQLTARDWEVTIATTLGGDYTWLPDFARYTPDIFILNHYLRLVDYPRFLRYLIRSRQIDVVLICSSYLGYELLPYLRAHCPDVTFLDYLHMEDETWKNGGYPRASLNHSSGLDLTVTSSKHLKDWLAKNGARPESIEVCTTNIDTQDWNPQRFDRVALRQGLDLDGSIPVILYAGRLCQQKQPELFAQVMHELTRLPYPFVCLVAGDGEERPFIEQYLKVNRLNGVRLLGAVSSQRMRELMAISDIFFLPSQMEGISLAIYEAMAMGVVPVSADVGGQSELVTSECGILVPRGETERNDYVRALEFLLQDPEQRARMGLAARRRVSGHFRLEQMGERMVQLMQRGQERSRQTPRIRIPLDLAHEFAALVIEYTRLEQVADYIWKQRQELLAAQPVEIPLRNLVLRYWARRIRHLIRPLYRWGLRHGMLFLEPMARKSVRQVRQWIYPSNGPSTSNR